MHHLGRAFIVLVLVSPALLTACFDSGKAPPDAGADARVDAMVDAPSGCVDASGCNDNNACTTDSCNSSHQCVHTPVAMDDSIACTTDACDPSTGTITHTPVHTMCEVDGKTCTVATCSATTGCSETPTPSVCDDGASCSTDACNPTGSGADPTTGCTHSLDNSICADSYTCTTNTCSPTAVAADPTTGCLVAPNDAACGDSVTCTVDACMPSGSGADPTTGCTHATNDNLCEVDGKSCTVPSCNATTGCSETPNDAACNDNASCSTESCSPTGPGASGCVRVLNDAACADSAECSTDACGPGMTGADATTGCLHTADSSVCSANAMCGTGFDCMCNAGFTGDGLTCTGITCDALTNPTNGSVSTSNSGVYPSTATYACNAGYAVTGSATRTCQTDGTWSGNAPTCELPKFFVVRVGDGAAALSSASTAVFLEERDSTGALVRTLPLPTAMSGNNAPLTLAGTSTTEGGLSLSTNGRYITLAGYAVAPGVASVNGTSNRSTDQTPTNRVVARVAADGTIDTSTRLVEAFSTSSVRGACTTDGSVFWVGGNGSPTSTAGVQYATLGSTTPTQILAMPSNARNVHIFGSQLYVSSAASGATGVLSVGTGTPTTTGQTATLLVNAATPDSFALLDLNPVVTGVDTMYVTLDGGGAAGTVNVQKWTFDGSTWTQATFAPTVTGTTIPRTVGLAAWLEGSSVHMVVTTTENPARILMIVDDGSTMTPAATVLATAGMNTAFRGVARSPTP